MSDLSIQVEQPGNELTIVRLTGLFEGMAAVEGGPQLSDILKKIKTPSLWLDFSCIEYIDSAALAVLIELAKEAAVRKIKFSLYRPVANVKKVLSITNVNKIISIIED